MLAMSNKPQTFAGIGGLIGAISSGFQAVKQYDFGNSDQLAEGVGYIIGGMLVGAIVGYVLGKIF